MLRTTARTPGMCGTWPSSSTRTGAQAARALPATSSSVAAHSRPRRASMAGRRLPDGPAASPARFRPGDGRLLRPVKSCQQAIVAQGRRNEGFRIVGRRGRQWDVRRLSRHVGEVRVPKVGWVRFRWSRAVPPGVKSYRVTIDRAGRWHVAFAAIPEPIPAPGNGKVVGVDRGVAVAAALSTGELLHVPSLTGAERKSAAASQTQACPRPEGLEPPHAREAWHRTAEGPRGDRRKDWVEKISTDFARRFDFIQVENLQLTEHDTFGSRYSLRPRSKRPSKSRAQPRHSALGWGLLVRRLETRQPVAWRRSTPRSVASAARRAGTWMRSRARAKRVFVCTACRFACNADVNAARNIAAGHAVTARGGDGVARPVNREPQLLLQMA